MNEGDAFRRSSFGEPSTPSSPSTSNRTACYRVDMIKTQGIFQKRSEKKGNIL